MNTTDFVERKVASTIAAEMIETMLKDPDTHEAIERLAGRQVPLGNIAEFALALRRPLARVFLKLVNTEIASTQDNVPG